MKHIVEVGVRGSGMTIGEMEGKGIKLFPDPHMLYFINFYI